MRQSGEDQLTTCVKTPSAGSQISVKMTARELPTSIQRNIANLLRSHFESFGQMERCGGFGSEAFRSLTRTIALCGLQVSAPISLRHDKPTKRLSERNDCSLNS